MSSIWSVNRIAVLNVQIVNWACWSGIFLSLSYSWSFSASLWVLRFWETFSIQANLLPFIFLRLLKSLVFVYLLFCRFISPSLETLPILWELILYSMCYEKLEFLPLTSDISSIKQRQSDEQVLNERAGWHSCFSKYIYYYSKVLSWI